ncbi:MAG: peptidyl-prolyl cis-trans isomerase [Chitinophagaceae bacterium]|nr:peptidyl-prolyl cis-trans isomerase [Oligoflexus sp.]
MLNKKRLVFLVILVGCFVFGAYFWKIRHTGAFFWRSAENSTSADDMDFTVHVGDYLITREEVEWEYKLYMNQIETPEVVGQTEGQPVNGEKPDVLDPLVKKPNMELYNKILADLIERKLLYQFLESDQKFTLKEPSRYTACVQEWADASKRLPALVQNTKNSEHLKSMLCEKSILTQYVRDRVNPAVTVSEDDIHSYFNTHKAEFVEPARVVIRQIAIGNEDEAKKIRAKANVQNFAQLAKENSITPEAKQGGILGPFAKGEMPSVFDIAFEMSPGSIQGILKSTYGFHILMLEKKIPRFELSYEAAKPKITKDLTQKRQEEEYKKWVESALNTIPIKSSRAF